MALHPTVYAKLLRDRITRHGATVWLMNTGWAGGPYGVGQRIKIAHTRAMVKAALAGVLAKTETVVDPIFGLHVPTECPDVPPGTLRPRDTWSDPAAYDAQADRLLQMFAENFAQFAGDVSSTVPQSR
jgi:phosphoenolpyruvate carboxykinase (ATP)